MACFIDNDNTLASSMAMIVAMPITNGRIAPLFDVARHLLVIECQRGREIRRREVHIGRPTLLGRLGLLSSNRVEILICEAVSTQLKTLVTAEKIKVIHHICGEVEPVLEAYLAGRLTVDSFLMPGCGDHRWHGFDYAIDVKM